MKMIVYLKINEDELKVLRRALIRERLILINLLKEDLKDKLLVEDKEEELKIVGYLLELVNKKLMKLEKIDLID